MAYYDALIAKWATAPAGSTDSKLTWVNAQTVTGAAIAMIVPTYKIYNLIVRSEFNALDAAGQQSVRDIIGMGTVDTSPGTQLRNQIVTLFPNGTATLAALSGLAAPYDTPPIPWPTATIAQGGGGLVAMVKPSDLTQAGLS